MMHMPQHAGVCVSLSLQHARATHIATQYTHTQSAVVRALRALSRDSLSLSLSLSSSSSPSLLLSLSLFQSLPSPSPSLSLSLSLSLSPFLPLSLSLSLCNMHLCVDVAQGD